MTDARMPGNELGGRQYSDSEQELIMAIALFLKSRDQTETAAVFQNYQDPKAIRPSDYMKFYVKAAGTIYELAKTLSTVVIRRQPSQKTVDDWLRIITGNHFRYISGPSFDTTVVEVQADPMDDNAPKTQSTPVLEQGRTHGRRDDGVEGQREPPEDPHEGSG